MNDLSNKHHFKENKSQNYTLTDLKKTVNNNSEF